MRNPLARAFRALENFNFRLWTVGWVAVHSHSLIASARA